jgi:glycosyltransferase, family 2
MDSLVSVIIPVYNVEKYVRKAINSVINQTYGKLEIILIDDGSTDGSAQICDELSAKDPRISVYHKENEGVSATRNMGIVKAKGDWLMFVDADDWIESNAVEKLLSIENTEDVDMILATYSWDFNGKETRASITGKRIIEYDIEQNRSEVLSACLLGPSEVKGLFKESFHFLPKISVPVAKLYKSSTVKDNGISFATNLALGEDTLFNLNFYMCAKKLIYINNTIYHYVIRRGSAVNSNLDIKKDLIIKLLSELEKFVYDKDERVQNAFRYFSLILIEEYIQNSGMIVSKLGGFKYARQRIEALIETATIRSVRSKFVLDSSVGRREKFMFYLIITGKSWIALLCCVLYYKLFPKKNRY